MPPHNDKIYYKMSNLRSGKFITFEGGEGIGKSTQCKMLYEYLISQNIPVILTREIGGTDIAEKMRNILINEELFPMSELLQVMAARYDHVVKKILPALTQGITVICDRFIDSTACYQGREIKNGIDLVYKLHQTLIPNCIPDITFFIDIAPEIAIKRVNMRNINNKFDLKDLEFYKKIHNCFKELCEKFPDRIISIEGAEYSVNEIHTKIKSYLL